MKHLSMIFLCLTMLFTVAACSPTGDGTKAGSIELSHTEEYKSQDSSGTEYRLRKYVDTKGYHSYYGITDGYYLTNKERMFPFIICDSNNPDNGTTPLHEEGYVPALILYAAISKGGNIYILDFEGSNDHQKLLEFAAEYIDANYE